MKKLRWLSLAIALILILLPVSASAQSYLFSLDELRADVFINQDGSVSLLYEFAFTNSPEAHPIDYVDVGMPTSNFSMNGVTAQVNGIPVKVSTADYQGNGSGFAVVMGSQSIPPGGKGRVRVFVPKIDPWLRTDSKDPNYASLEFSPTWFGKEYVQGKTNMTVTFHLPPGVKPEEPRWHASPSGFSAEPLTGLDDQGRITYTWGNPAALGYQQYKFGASFPAQYVPAGVVVNPTISETLGIDPGAVSSCTCFAGIVAIFAGIFYAASRAAAQRKLQYLPPKIAIEGLGIKRGLTAVEAAILMEQPLDKVLTMILFGLVKKGAAEVVKQDPLEIKAIQPAPVELLDYEKGFLRAFQKTSMRERRADLQNMTIDLVKSVSNKMKGFSRKETIAYYKDIMERAWKQVENAQTPEVRMEAFDKYMEWTMLDREYDDRTRRVFTGPVFVPQWWGRYDPTFRPATTGGPKTVSAPTSSSGGQGGGFSLPSLPGSAFAASMVRGVQNFSSNVIGNVTDFTSSITNRTNPPPPPSTTRSSGGGGGCACACACAGCACACAGGGR
jgi:hypothetical protein